MSSLPVTRVVSFALDDGTEVGFEVVPVPGMGEAGTQGLVGRVREAAEPAVRAAREVLERVREAAPDEAVVRFGLKVSGRMDWLVARAATEGNFEVELTWRLDATSKRPMS
jgi:hypothetical protein